MARSQSPDSASSQFYFTLTDVPFLDGSYAVFGYVKQGMDVVDKIEAAIALIRLLLLRVWKILSLLAEGSQPILDLGF
jgi:Peptidyl-prolyl cis-trans isomerase (rotamase) - cyclophilin family